jgi:beta-galactosidase
LDEAGRPTPKYKAMRDVIIRHLGPGAAVPEVPPVNKIISVPSFKLTQATGLYALLGKPTISDTLLSMEDLNQGYGFILYRTVVKKPMKGLLKIHGLRDYALVFVNKARVAILDRRIGQDSIEIAITDPNSTLDIFVENLGRINYGKRMTDNRKGIIGNVLLADEALHGWRIYSLPFDRDDHAQFAGRVLDGVPVLRKGEFTVTETGDTFLDMRPWGKGCVWINGHNIGRYWYIGAQQTLYVPAPWLRKGKNEITIFEQLLSGQDAIEGLTTPIIDQLRNP